MFVKYFFLKQELTFVISGWLRGFVAKKLDRADKTESLFLLESLYVF